MIGAKNIPLACVVRARDIVDYIVPLVLVEDACHAEDVMPLEEELIKRASHCHPLFKVDNTATHCVLEEATRSTVCSASIKPFQRKKDGRNAWLSIVKHYAGDYQ